VRSVGLGDNLAWEQDGQKWPKEMQELLLEIKGAVEKAGGSLDERTAKKLRKRYRSILGRAEDECPAPQKTDLKPKRRIKKSKARNLLERLRDFETEVLRFMTDKRVPLTNNPGENAIRMMKCNKRYPAAFDRWKGRRSFVAYEAISQPAKNRAFNQLKHCNCFFLKNCRSSQLRSGNTHSLLRGRYFRGAGRILSKILLSYSSVDVLYPQRVF
jgi:hypothetical protein